MKSKRFAVLFVVCFALVATVATTHAQVSIVIDILANGDFSQGAQDWQMSSTYYPTPLQTIGSDTFAFLGGANSETTEISQTITLDPWLVPSELELEYSYRIFSAEGLCHFDTVEVGVWEHYWFSPSTYHVIDQIGLCYVTHTGTNAIPVSFDLSDYRHANELTIVFKGQTDGSIPSSFEFDNVRLWSTS